MVWRSQMFFLAALGRASAIYQETTDVTVDSAALKDAFAQAQSAMLTEALQKAMP